MSDKLVWRRLKDMKCPKCNSDVKSGLLSDEITCTNCDFRISRVKFDKIVGDLYRPKAERDAIEDNLAEWNRYGHEMNSEDFSDSPHADRR